MNQKLGRKKRKQLSPSYAGSPRARGVRRPFFHGGNVGLEVGGYILPPAETNAPQNGDVPSHIRGRDHIYMVREFVHAAPWAARHAIPTIYEVVPEGSVENDPDVEKPGLSYRCRKAKILAIHEIPSDMLAAARRKLLR